MGILFIGYLVANIKGESEDKRMKKIIDGKVYNTDTAKKIGEWSYGRYGDINYVEETLYQTKKGAFFIYYEGGANTSYGVDTGNFNRSDSRGIFDFNTSNVMVLLFFSLHLVTAPSYFNTSNVMVLLPVQTNF